MLQRFIYFWTNYDLVTEVDIKQAEYCCKMQLGETAKLNTRYLAYLAQEISWHYLETRSAIWTLKGYQFPMLDTQIKNHDRNEALERITELVKDIFNVDVAAVSLIEDNKQIFRSILGSSLKEVPLEESFCLLPWQSRGSVIIQDTALALHLTNHPLRSLGDSPRFYAGMPLITSDGELIGTICALNNEPRPFSARELRILENLAFLASSEFELLEFAKFDVLTNALTRRQFFKDAKRIILAAEKNELKVSVIVLDIDRFKSINDAYGHQAGDEVLKSIAASCAASLREFDLFGRLGGEEFAILVQGAADRARRLAERLRKLVNSLQFDFGEERVQVTSSFGVASIERTEDGFIQALQNADVALYRAKNCGRNRVEIF